MPRGLPRFGTAPYLVGRKDTRASFKRFRAEARAGSPKRSQVRLSGKVRA
jgi:hypothetical protein